MKKNYYFVNSVYKSIQVKTYSRKVKGTTIDWDFTIK